MYTRPSEIASGDHYFMPFLSAGWTEREEMSLRPAQLLGLLKTTVRESLEISLVLLHLRSLY